MSEIQSLDRTCTSPWYSSAYQFLSRRGLAMMPFRAPGLLALAVALAFSLAAAVSDGPLLPT